MKKFILHLAVLFWSIITIFGFNSTIVNADWLLNQHSVGQLELPWTGSANGTQELIPSLQRWLNWLVGILAILALFIMVYWWILMVTASWDDEKYKKWWTIMKQVAIGLIYIGLSWLFIMLVFYVVLRMMW